MNDIPHIHHSPFISQVCKNTKNVTSKETGAQHRGCHLDPMFKLEIHSFPIRSSKQRNVFKLIKCTNKLH